MLYHHRHLPDEITEYCEELDDGLHFFTSDDGPG